MREGRRKRGMEQWAEKETVISPYSFSDVWIFLEDSTFCFCWISAVFFILYLVGRKLNSSSSVYLAPSFCAILDFSLNESPPVQINRCRMICQKEPCSLVQQWWKRGIVQLYQLFNVWLSSMVLGFSNSQMQCVRPRYTNRKARGCVRSEVDHRICIQNTRP